VTGRELRQILRAADEDGGYVDNITVTDDSHLILPAGQPNGKGNHGCDPNLWWDGDYTLVASRDIVRTSWSDIALLSARSCVGPPPMCVTRDGSTPAAAHDRWQMSAPPNRPNVVAG
jgi:hypothetical protein